MKHSLHSGGSNHIGFTTLATTIETCESSAEDSDYANIVKEHEPLKYLRKRWPII